MLPCLRAGYQEAISEFMAFFNKECNDIPHEMFMKISEKFIQMMTQKKQIDWKVLRQEQADVLSEIVKQKNSPVDDR